MKLSKLSVNDILNLNDSQIQKMGENDLRSLVNKLASAANKRVRRLQESNLASRSGAIRGIRGGAQHRGAVKMFTTDFKKLKAKTLKYKKNVYRLEKYTTKHGIEKVRRIKTHSRGETILTKEGKPLTSYRGKLIKEFARASRFLNDKTSSVTGTRKTIRDVNERLGGFKSKAQANRFWDAYNSVRADYGEMIRGRKISTDEIQKMIYERMFKSGASPKGDAVDKVIDAMRKEMESSYVKSQQTSTEGETPFSVRFEKIKIF